MVLGFRTFRVPGRERERGFRSSGVLGYRENCTAVPPQKKGFRGWGIGYDVVH